MEGFQDPYLFRGGIRRQLWPGLQKHGQLLHAITKADDIGSDESVFGFHFTKKLSFKMAGPAYPPWYQYLFVIVKLGRLDS